MYVRYPDVSYHSPERETNEKMTLLGLAAICLFFAVLGRPLVNHSRSGGILFEQVPPWLCKLEPWRRFTGDEDRPSVLGWLGQMLLLVLGAHNFQIFNSRSVS